MRRPLLPSLLFISLSVTFAQTENRISPFSVRNGYWDLYLPASKWDTLKTMIQTISIHVNALETRDTALITQAVETIGAAGCKVNFEVGGLQGNCVWSVARAAEEIVDDMKAVRRQIPGVTFALIEPVPWYRVGADPNHPGNTLFISAGSTQRIAQFIFQRWVSA